MQLKRQYEETSRLIVHPEVTKGTVQAALIWTAMILAGLADLSFKIVFVLMSQNLMCLNHKSFFLLLAMKNYTSG